MTEAELAAIEAKTLPYGRFNGELWSVDKDGVDDVIVSGVSIEFATYVLGMHEHILDLLVEVRRLRAALERARDNEVVPTESRTGVICHVCHALGTVDRMRHAPDVACGIAQAALADTAQE